jgi:RsiW-degrading membrane proteinase PrsW (M82 family)
MNGIWILLILIATAALPVIIVFFWFRLKKPAVTLFWFLVSLAAGIISLLAAALIQGFFPSPDKSGQGGPGAIFFNVFIRIALAEEASRLVTLIPLFKAGKRRRNMDRPFYASLGFTAGLGFAMLESAFYGMADINITLLRAFTAAPLHGACGIMTGMAVFICRQRPVKALFLLVSAVLIHGTYNLMIENPALPSALAVVTAFAALFASLPYFSAGGIDADGSPVK